jgi:two-component SAPR family response regulator
MKNTQVMDKPSYKEESTKETQRESIKIITLGNFDVIKNGASLVQTSMSSKKLWELYQFMFTNRERAFTPEALMNQLWIDQDYSDPRSTLRRQMFRLRKLLGEDNIKEDMTSIVFVNGFYQWNNLLPVEFDVDLFTQYLKEAESFSRTDEAKALQYYERAIELYRDDYLPQCMEIHWVFPVRNRLKHKFFDAALKAAGIMKQLEYYAKIIVLAEKAIQVDFYEEAFHFILMEAKLIKGEYKSIIDHYQFMVEQYKQELGIEPSEDIKRLYQQVLQSHQSLSSKETIHQAFDITKDHKNAYYCEPDIFKAIFELESRRSERDGLLCSLGVLNIDKHKVKSPSQCEIYLRRLKTSLSNYLRKGDALTQWNREQMIVLLSGADSAITRKILHRILEKENLLEVFVVSQATELKEL